MNLRDRILQADDLPREPVEVPEWGATVWVRTLTAAERERWEAEAVGEGGRARTRFEVRASLVVLAACDEAGAPVFEPGDVPALATKAAPAVIRLFDRALALNAVAPADVERLEKNSAASPSDSSHSGSRANSAAPVAS